MDPRRAAPDIRDALALWRGQPYAELDVVDAASGRGGPVGGGPTVSLEMLASAELAAGRHREVVAELESLVAEHPFRERFCARSWSRCTGRAGRPRRSGRTPRPGPGWPRSWGSIRARAAGPRQRVLQQDPVLLGDVDVAAPRPPSPVRPHPSPPVPRCRFAVLARSPLLGRAAELRALDDAWEAVAPVTDGW